jgi:hypothetical protein
VNKFVNFLYAEIQVSGTLFRVFVSDFRIYISMESSVSNRFRMVIFSLHCLKEFPNSALKMMTRYIFRNLQTHSRRHAIAIRAALTVPSLLPGSDEAPP